MSLPSTGASAPSNAALKDSRTPDKDTRSCGRLGPAALGSTFPRSRSSTSLKTRLGVSIGSEQTLFSRVPFDQVDERAAAGQIQISQGVRVDREER